MKRLGILGTMVLFAMFGFTALARAQDQHDEKAAPEKHQEEAKPEKAHQDDKAAKPEKQEARPQEQHDQGKQNDRQSSDRQNQENKDQQKAAKDQQKQEENAQKDQRKEEDQQKKQTEEQQKNAQHDQQKNNDQQRNNQPVNGQQRQDTQRPMDQQRMQQATAPSQQQRGNGGGEQRAAFQEHRAKNWQSEHKTWAQRGGYRGYRIPEDRFRTSFGEAHRFRLASYPVVVEDGFPRFQINGFWFALVDPWPEYWADDWYNTDDCYVTYDNDGYYLEDVRYPGVRLAINVFVG